MRGGSRRAGSPPPVQSTPERSSLRQRVLAARGVSREEAGATSGLSGQLPEELAEVQLSCRWPLAAPRGGKVTETFATKAFSAKAFSFTFSFALPRVFALPLPPVPGSHVTTRDKPRRSGLQSTGVVESETAFGIVCLLYTSDAADE